jgi:hypothetical protein
MSRFVQSLNLVALAVLITTCTAHAKPFDLIYADRIDVRECCYGSSGFIADTDIGIVVNTGTSEVTASELAGAIFSTSCSEPSVAAVVWIDDAGLGGPVVPNEAVGSLTCGYVLPALLLPGEILRSMHPKGVMLMRMDYPDVLRQVVVDVTMTMGTDVAHYSVTVSFTSAEEWSITMPHATRVSSTPVTADVPVSSAGLAWRTPPGPNPRRGPFTLGFALPRAGEGSLVLYDVTGRKVRGLSRGWLEAGSHLVTWDGRDESGVEASAGVYVVRLVTKDASLTRTLVRLK